MCFKVIYTYNNGYKSPYMRHVIRQMLYLLMAALMLVTTLEAQQKKALAATRKKEKVERSYKKAYAKARKRTIKHRREIQTQATKERMDEADKRADLYNKQNDPSFLEGIL